MIDDDCIPKIIFLKFILVILKIDSKTILSGIVDYPKKYIINYNHIKYRNLKHFKNDKFISNNVMPDKIVAMNMGFKNQK